MKEEKPEILTLDVRPLFPSQRHPLIFFILEKLREIGIPEVLQVISDHKPVGIEIELEGREETKGRYSFSYEGHSEDVWAFKIERKEEI